MVKKVVNGYRPNQLVRIVDDGNDDEVIGSEVAAHRAYRGIGVHGLKVGVDDR